MNLRNTTCYKLAGTKFFRASASQLITGAGTNLQNVEKSMRAIYIPDGYIPIEDDAKCLRYLETRDISVFDVGERARLKVMLQVDQSGAEALIVSYYCKPAKFRSLFLNGVKPHVYIALHNFTEEFKSRNPEMAQLLDAAVLAAIPALKLMPDWKKLDSYIKSSDNWPAAERYYFIAKMICHALNYGMKAPTFQLNVLEKSEGKVVLARDIAELYCSNYHSLFPEIRWWNEECKEQVLSKRYIYNMMGYPIYFHDVDETDMKDVFAAGPQSTVGCITHRAFTNLQSYIETERKPWDLLNNSHDSYLVQVPVGDELEAGAKMQELMNQQLTSPRGEVFSMKSECQWGFNWAPAKSLPDKYKGETLTAALINKFNLVGLRELQRN